MVCLHFASSLEVIQYDTSTRIHLGRSRGGVVASHKQIGPRLPCQEPTCFHAFRFLVFDSLLDPSNKLLILLDVQFSIECISSHSIYGLFFINSRIGQQNLGKIGLERGVTGVSIALTKFLQLATIDVHVTAAVVRGRGGYDGWEH